MRITQACILLIITTLTLSGCGKKPNTLEAPEYAPVGDRYPRAFPKRQDIPGFGPQKNAPSLQDDISENEENSLSETPEYQENQTIEMIEDPRYIISE